MGRDRWRQPGRKDSPVHASSFPGPARFKAPSHTPLRRCKCMLWLQTEQVWPPQGEDGLLE